MAVLDTELFVAELAKMTNGDVTFLKYSSKFPEMMLLMFKHEAKYIWIVFSVFCCGY